MAKAFDIDLLDDDDPFVIDREVARLFKQPQLGALLSGETAGPTD